MDSIAASAIREGIIAIVKIGGPALLAGLLIGIVISMIQAVTQIHEATLAFLPKIITIFLTFLLLGPFCVRVMSGFAHLVFDHIVIIGGS
jgi:flagellar biosynthetic protein FliQ